MSTCVGKHAYVDMLSLGSKVNSMAPQANINTFTFASPLVSITTSQTYNHSSNDHIRFHQFQCLHTPQFSSPAQPVASEQQSYTTSYTPTTSTQPPSSPPPALLRTATNTSPKAFSSANSTSLARRLSALLSRVSVSFCSSAAVRGTLLHATESIGMSSKLL